MTEPTGKPVLVIFWDEKARKVTAIGAAPTIDKDTAFAILMEASTKVMLAELQTMFERETPFVPISTVN